MRLFGDSQAGAPISKAHPHLALAYPDMKFERFEPASLDGIDLVFAALPHGASQALPATIVERDIAFVDLGADFRLRDPNVSEPAK